MTPSSRAKPVLREETPMLESLRKSIRFFFTGLWFLGFPAGTKVAGTGVSLAGCGGAGQAEDKLG